MLQYSKNTRRWFIIQGILKSLLKCVLYYGLWLLGQVIVIAVTDVVIILGNPGISSTDAANILMDYIVEIQIISNCLSVLLVGLFLSLRSKSIVQEGHFNKMPLKYTLNAVILGVSATYAIAMLIGLIPFPEKWRELLTQTNSPITSSTSVIMFVMVVVMAPLWEELLFRGLIIGTLKKSMNPWIAVTLSALAFGFSHGSPFDMEKGNPIGFFYSLVLGFLMGAIFVKFNSILPGLIFHAAYNFTAGFATSPEPLVVIISVPIMIIEIIILFSYKPSLTKSGEDTNDTFGGNEQ